MNHINVSLTVNRSLRETQLHVARFFAQHAPQGEMTFALRAPFDVTPLHVGVTLRREVVARFNLLADETAYAVAWQPVAAGPFPSLAGTLFLTADEANPNETNVTLDGHYHPPLGVAGDMFDAIIGRHIGQASTLDLLERIALAVDAVPERLEAFT